MTTPLGPAYANPPGIRIDPERLDPGWRGPQPPRASGSTILLAVLAVAVLVLGTIWAGGGFAERTDQVQAYPLGEEVDVGSFTITFTHVEVSFQEAEEIGTKPERWSIRAHGTATNTTGAPLVLYKPGYVGLANGFTISGYDLYPQLRTETGEWKNTRGLSLEAGLPDVPVILSGELPGAWEPTGHIFVGVRLQSYAAHEINQGLTSERWSNAPAGVAGFWAPVRILPPGS
ncbi:MAG: hypothetical protein Q4F67_01735 [Propionibacteriaceae bacterium]|nr:hypothetical protein [Propionibacteriaceae bacterium]